MEEVPGIEANTVCTDASARRSVGSCLALLQDERGGLVVAAARRSPDREADGDGEDGEGDAGGDNHEQFVPVPEWLC